MVGGCEALQGKSWRTAAEWSQSQRYTYAHTTHTYTHKMKLKYYDH